MLEIADRINLWEYLKSRYALQALEGDDEARNRYKVMLDTKSGLNMIVREGKDVE